MYPCLPRRGARFVLVVASVLAGGAVARELPDFDALARLPARKAAATPVPGVDLDPRLGVPRFLWAPRTAAVGSPLAKRAFDPAETARGALRGLADTYRITPAEVDTLPVHDVQRLSEGGAIVRFGSQVGGVEVFREDASVLLDPHGALVAVSGHALGATPTAKKAATDPFAQGPAPAVATALGDWGFARALAQQLVFAGEEDGYRSYALPAGCTRRQWRLARAPRAHQARALSAARRARARVLRRGAGARRRGRAAASTPIRT